MKSEELKDHTINNKKSVDILWIIILVVLMGITIYWRRNKEFIKMVNRSEFLFGIIILIIFICIIFFNNDELYKKSIYISFIAFIIA